MTQHVFETNFPQVGNLALRPLDIPGDIPTVHGWVRQDYARYWGMQSLSEAEVEKAYVSLTAIPSVDVFIGEHQGGRAFLTEFYRPHVDPLARFYDARASDRGMHLLVGPPQERISGFTRTIFRTVLEMLFADPHAQRVVVEPDVRNEKIRALNRAFGFTEVRELELPDSPTAPGKTAMLSWCSRSDFAQALDQSEDDQ